MASSVASFGAFGDTDAALEPVATPAQTARIRSARLRTPKIAPNTYPPKPGTKLPEKGLELPKIFPGQQRLMPSFEPKSGWTDKLPGVMQTPDATVLARDTAPGAPKKAPRSKSVPLRVKPADQPPMNKEPHDHNEAAKLTKIKKAANRLARVLQKKADGGEDIFDLIDADRSDKITRSEFELKVYDLGALSRQTTVDMLFDFMDKDHSGAINMSEFTKMLLIVRMEQDAKSCKLAPAKSGVNSPGLRRRVTSGVESASEVQITFKRRMQVQQELQKALATIRRRGKTPAAVANGSYRLMSGQGMYTAMKFFDKDGSGTCGVAELRKALTMIGMPLSDAMLEDIVAVYDADGSGTMEAEELVAAFFPKANIWKPVHSMVHV